MARFVEIPPHLFPIHNAAGACRGALYANDALARRPASAFQVVVLQSPLPAEMVACRNLPRVGMPGGNPIAHIAAIAQLRKYARRLRPSRLAIGMPKLNVGEAGFASPIALGMPETQHPARFLRFHRILSNRARPSCGE